MKLRYVILYVADVRATVEFYERAFGLARRMVHESGDWAELDTGDTRLSFAARSLIDAGSFESRSPDPAAPVGEVAFVTDDVAGAFERATDAGADPVHAPEAKPWGQTVAYVRDLDGHFVELCTSMD